MQTSKCLILTWSAHVLSPLAGHYSEASLPLKPLCPKRGTACVTWAEFHSTPRSFRFPLVWACWGSALPSSCWDHACCQQWAAVGGQGMGQRRSTLTPERAQNGRDCHGSWQFLGSAPTGACTCSFQRSCMPLLTRCVGFDCLGSPGIAD